MSGPLLVFLVHEWWITRSSVSKWLFLGCFVVALMALVDFPLQNPVVFCQFAVFLTLAGKYSLIQTRRKRFKQSRSRKRPA